MRKDNTLEGTYSKCTVDGSIIPVLEVDNARIESMLKIADEDLNSIEQLKKKSNWNTLYKLTYDVLHSLAEAYLLFDKVKSANHLCLFTALCIRHPKLELDWNFFELIRTKRNGINYYGTGVEEADYKKIELQSTLYIRLFKDEINKKLPK